MIYCKHDSQIKNKNNKKITIKMTKLIISNLQKKHFLFVPHIILLTISKDNNFFKNLNVPSYRDEVESLIKIYRKLVSSCQITSKALAASSSAIAKPHASIEVYLTFTS